MWQMKNQLVSESMELVRALTGVTCSLVFAVFKNNYISRVKHLFRLFVIRQKVSQCGQCMVSYIKYQNPFKGKVGLVLTLKIGDN